MAKRATILAAVLAAACLTGGCQKGMQISGGDAKLPAVDGSPEYIDQTSAETSVSENQAMRGMVLLLDGDDTAGSFDQRVQTLVDRGVASSTWSFDAARPITKGKLAYMVYQACKVRGGVILTLTGPSQRYCLRELQYIGMMGQGSMFLPVTGMELVAALGRADAYRETGEIPDVLKTYYQE